MSIETELIAAKGYLDDCYDAVSYCSGTVPQNQCLANLPNAINSISGGVPTGGVVPRYGVDPNGDVITDNITYPSNTFSSVTYIDTYALCDFISQYGGIVNNKTYFTNLIFDSLTEIAYRGCRYAFYGCLIQSAQFPLLTIINAEACSDMFSQCEQLSSVDLSSLTTIGQLGCSNMFNRCTSLTTISFPSLINVDMQAFQTSQGYSQIFGNCTNLTEIHFKSGAQNVISSIYGYSSKWGATNATIYFDLP